MVLHSVVLIRILAKKVIIHILYVNRKYEVTSSYVVQSEATNNNGSTVSHQPISWDKEDTSLKGSSDVRILLHYIIIHHYHRRGERFWLNPPPFYCTQTPQYHRGEEDNSGRAGQLTLLLISTEFDLHST